MQKVPSGPHRLGVRVERLLRKEPPAKGSRTGVTAYTLLIDGEAAGGIQTQSAFNNFISWSGLDIGRDRSSLRSRITRRRSNSPGSCSG